MIFRSLFRSAFGAYVRGQIRSGLDGVWVRGLLEVEGVMQSRPVVLAATHSSWWDAMLLLPLDDALGRTSRVWMSAENLRKLPFFGPLGAIPLDASGVGGLRRSVRAASSWLSEPGRALWVFPQGQHRPGWARPLCLQPGAAWLARQVDAEVVPVAISYGFRESAQPAAAVSFGSPVHPDHLEGGLLQQLAHTDGFFLGTHEGFDAMVEPRKVRSEAGAGTRMLAWASQGVGHG